MSKTLLPDILPSLVIGIPCMAQTPNACSGTGADSRAVVPDVIIGATNTQAGISTKTLSNEAGADQFPSLPGGTHKLTADLTGFQADPQRSGYNRIVVLNAPITIQNPWVPKRRDR
jgi:hypothetical protein